MKMNARLGRERWAKEKSEIPRSNCRYFTFWGSRLLEVNLDSCTPFSSPVSQHRCKAGIFCQFCRLSHERSGRERPCKQKKERFKKLCHQLEQLISGIPEDQWDDVSHLEQFAQETAGTREMD